jgi:hypothetical protein
VAYRLFPDGVARHHFHDFAATARQVPVRRLAYPRRRGVGPAVATAIAAALTDRRDGPWPVISTVL